MTNEDLHNKEPRSSTEIESNIRQTRGRMDATLDELSDRMTARSLLNSALDWWESRNADAPGRNVTSDAFQTVGRRVRENPLPSLLIGFGLVWMITEAASKDDEETGSIAGGNSPYKEGRTRMRAARLPHTPTNTRKSKRRSGSGTLAAWLKRRKTNWEKQKKQSRELLGVLRRRWPLWGSPRPRLRRASVEVHKMCMSKAARLRRRLAATSSVGIIQLRNRWRAPWRSILSPWELGSLPWGP